jgi:hypothetical protein
MYAQFLKVTGLALSTLWYFYAKPNRFLYNLNNSLRNLETRRPSEAPSNIYTKHSTTLPRSHRAPRVLHHSSGAIFAASLPLHSLLNALCLAFQGSTTDLPSIAASQTCSSSLSQTTSLTIKNLSRTKHDLSRMRKPERGPRASERSPTRVAASEGSSQGARVCGVSVSAFWLFGRRM